MTIEDPLNIRAETTQKRKPRRVPLSITSKVFAGVGWLFFMLAFKLTVATGLNPLSFFLWGMVGCCLEGFWLYRNGDDWP